MLKVARETYLGPLRWLWSALLVAAVTFVAFGLLRISEENEAEHHFRKDAVERLDRLEANIHLALIDLIHLGAYYDTNGTPDRGKFQRVAQGLLADDSLTQTLEWIPRVPDAQRARYVEAARRDGHANYDFTQRLPDGSSVSAERRPEYFPVYFAEPAFGNEKALGFDLGSSAGRRAILEESAASGKMLATGRFRLVQEKSDQYGFLVFRPVYEQGSLPQDASQRRAKLKAFALGVFRVGDIVESGRKTAESQVQLDVFDEDAVEGEHRLYPSLSNIDSADALPAGYRSSRQLRVAGRAWRAVATPRPGTFVADRQASTLVLLLGLVISALSAFSLRRRWLDHDNVNRLVGERTKQLHQLNQRFTLAAGAAGIGVWDYLVLEDLLIWDEHMYALYGISKAEFSGAYQAWRGGLHPDDLARGDAEIDAALRGETPFDTEFRVVWPTGEVRHLKAAAMVQRDAEGKALRMIGVNYDITERKHSEEVLRTHQIELELQNEQLQQAQLALDVERARYFDLYELAPAGYCSVSKNGLIRQANLSISTLLDVARGELVGQPISRFILTEDQDIFYLNRKQVFESGERRAFELHMVNHGGRQFWAQLTASVADLTDGAPELRIVLQDITESKRQGEALSKSEASYRRMFDNAIEGILILSSTGHLVAANDAFARMHGYSVEEIQNISLKTLSTDESFQLMRHILLGESSTFEIGHHHARGHTFQLEVSVNLIDSDGELLIECIHRDITERKLKEAALRESERFAHATLDALSANLAILDESGTIVAVNGAWRRYSLASGTEPDKLSEGLNYLAVCDAASGAKSAGAAEMAAGVRSVLQRASNEFAQEYACDSPTQARWFQARVTRFPGEGAPLVIVAHEDITERKRNEAASKALGSLREANARLELLVDYKQIYQNEKLAALGVMAGGIAHEVRNPLSVGFSAAQFLLEESCDPAFAQECAQKIISSIQQASTIIENLLRFARPSTDSQMRLLDLVALVRETISVLAPQAKVQNLAVIEVYDDPSLQISGNRTLLQQVIVNLMLNAFQATPNGGTIRTVVLRDAEAAEAVVRVSDTGHGIPSAQLDHVFDPFFTTKLAEKGTGLGLSICHTIVKQHGGSMSVESVEGVRSTFTVRLPLCPQVG